MLFLGVVCCGLKKGCMLKLGHIIYSNCFPPHAGIVTKKVAFPFTLVEGIPTELNRLLYEGAIDVSPSSSIEYAMNPGRYVLLPDLSITSRNQVMSIILQSRVPLTDLDGKTVALTTASATSVMLLRILLELLHKLHPSYIRYTQGVESPSDKADAFLTIGDLALTQTTVPGYLHRYDLGELWHEFTGLPFVFALWHVNYTKEVEKELCILYDILKASKSYGLSHVQELAREYTDRFRIPEQMLVHYWNSFSYAFGEDERKGLLQFYAFAAKLGAIKPITELNFWRRR
jgi:chorismate dehydratase